MGFDERRYMDVSSSAPATQYVATPVADEEITAMLEHKEQMQQKLIDAMGVSAEDLTLHSKGFHT